MEKTKRYLEKHDDGDDRNLASAIDDLPLRFYEQFVMTGLRVDLIEPGRVVCSLKVPARLLNENNSLHGGATAALVDCIGSAAIKTFGVSTTGVSVEINVSYMDAAYLDEQIEIESKVLRMGKTIAVVNVELRKKSNGKIVAQGRHTKYLAISSKL
ncbi:acyl-coenzyme A thioesterase 13 isoform X1 [Momordica charantia]|uniref:Acyl-coenzyme A thioesterase 13 isoform X1 n=1 Tax=Momordica charantia TaxID=3673 RepID=A0A6J1E0I3_MOMCH|nr:acyl-coenzyme A thioesterase 13 isoform X1 [Momordica charantia]